jgi:hypothetical protein
MSWSKEKNGMSELPEPAGRVYASMLGNIVLETHIHDMMEGFARPDSRAQPLPSLWGIKGPDADSR